MISLSCQNLSRQFSKLLNKNNCFHSCWIENLVISDIFFRLPLRLRDQQICSEQEIIFRQFHYCIYSYILYILSGSESSINDFIPASPVKKAASKTKADKTGFPRLAGSPTRSPRTGSPGQSPHSSPRHNVLAKAKCKYYK